MKKVLTSALLSATILGAGLVISGNVSAADAIKGAATTTGVQFVADDGSQVIPPVDPTDPTKPVDPTDPGTGNEGNLAIVYATKAISFGDKNVITASTVNLKADKDVVVEVGDVRGTNAGWDLSVKSDQLTDGKTNTLTGAQLGLAAGKNVVANGGTSVAATTAALADTTTGAVVLNAVKDTGSGINVDTIAKDGVTLTIPAGIAKADVAYASTLTWSLAAAPVA
ncbi:WxL domain-containing protein [Dellaglioa algida]|uniref:WxL domain-containing protein n=1 Tax=Dellaglioa algida TaxID=105612 RepID=UPI0024C4AE84|nr:WxL domain-containing protein [Dellaglioa algida]MDK1726929.1 WxL domain-containing protein [Dellaglioa algida]